MSEPKRKVKISRFAHQVYAQCRRIPSGKVVSYIDIAVSLGKPGAARAVGQALHRNPWAPSVPCHRVIRHNGELGGYASGKKAKIRLLRAENISLKKGKIDLPKYRYFFRKMKTNQPKRCGFPAYRSVTPRRQARLR